MHYCCSRQEQVTRGLICALSLHRVNRQYQLNYTACHFHWAQGTESLIRPDSVKPCVPTTQLPFKYCSLCTDLYTVHSVLIFTLFTPNWSLYCSLRTVHFVLIFSLFTPYWSLHTNLYTVHSILIFILFTQYCSSCCSLFLTLFSPSHSIYPQRVNGSITLPTKLLVKGSCSLGNTTVLLHTPSE